MEKPEQIFGQPNIIYTVCYLEGSSYFVSILKMQSF